MLNATTSKFNTENEDLKWTKYNIKWPVCSAQLDSVEMGIPGFHLSFPERPTCLSEGFGSRLLKLRYSYFIFFLLQIIVNHKYGCQTFSNCFKQKIRNPFIYLGKAYVSLRIWFKVTKIKVRSCLVSRVVIKQINRE